MTKVLKKKKTTPAIRKKFQKKKQKQKNIIDLKNLTLKEDLKKTKADRVIISFDQTNNLKRLIRDIYNVREARRQIYFLGVDVKNISRHIGENFLNDCKHKLSKIFKIMSSSEKESYKNKIYFELSKEYNKLIPHNYYFPSIDLFLINNKEKIKKEIRLLELLNSYRELRNKDYQIRESIEKEENESINLNESLNMSVNNAEISVEEENHVNISSSYYKKAIIGTKYLFQLVDEKTSEFDKINKFLLRFSEKNKCPFPKLKLLQLFRLNKKEEGFTEYENLFWYGCETPHLYSILRHGLRMPITLEYNNIYKYGKGIMISHSPYGQLKYCITRNNIVYLFVCGNNGLKSKVARDHYIYPEYPEKLDKQYDSLCIERRIKLIKNKDEEEEENEKTRNYDYYCDYIIYDLTKINLLYIAKIQIP